MINFQSNSNFAVKLDDNDKIKDLRNLFNFPINDPIYLCGHSLGLQPKQTKQYIDEVIEDWSNFGVEGHLKGNSPWFDYHTFLTSSMSKLVGANNSEVVVMNSLTTNLHLLMLSFYSPENKRRKILIDIPAFPSDKFAVQSQLKMKNFDPVNDLIQINTLTNNNCKSNQQILLDIEENLDKVAMVLLSGVNYYTGQLYDIKSIAELCKKYNCILGLDLAHAAGNVELKLNEWGVDFASWCGYKYLNGGPGAPAGIFVHEKHNKKNFNRLEGWWGHKRSKRFNPPEMFSPLLGAEAWQLSNPPILSMAALRSSLDLFNETDMSLLIEKRNKLTGYLEYLINKLDNNISIITPCEKENRGAQLSIIINSKIENIENYFKSKNIICDFRKPNVIRVAPNPFYNSFNDIFNFVNELKKL